ncbi:transcription-repair coupling factor (superfamily II helicase) [Catalinimonas alkaloidigena]|uniref:Transcription-repair-coupling factor n=1 Tax=Catalinimonas alkaloidigena TaxID=1075417 RepID=A0A1G9EU16_9BACT|nr:transcription-repair coupling factor [Catalinimonas alkaloidigena]SDK79604.1 transcription-repair coupling factor (superfamily II helicase) [Catalinimonas alkaloidigena]
MQVTDFLQLYKQDPLVQTLAEKLRASKSPHLHLKGLIGSLDAVVAAALFELRPSTFVYVLHDREEAAYFMNDLQFLLPKRPVLMFPTSYKRAYQFEEVDNANVLLRAEVLNHLNEHRMVGSHIVTYPEALTEKVINKRALTENTLSAKVGDQLDTNFLNEVLSSYDFERTDFVYEPGQYAIRGGIIDVYSFAGDLPFRIELFGDEVESIRTFDPNTQLSVEKRESVAITPNVQTKLTGESRESFFGFVPDGCVIWYKDWDLTLDIIGQSFEKVQQVFDQILEKNGERGVALPPDHLYETPTSFAKNAAAYPHIEFGNRFSREGSAADVIQFEAHPQPSFNKDFQLLADNLAETQAQEFVNIITAEMPKQTERLQTIFEELNPHLKFQPLNISLRQGFIDDLQKIVCYTDHQIFDRFHRYHTKDRYSKTKALTLKELQSLQPGDYVTHVDYGIGRFAGLEKVEVNGKAQEAIRLVYRDDDFLLVSIHALHKIARYSGKEGGPPQINKLGSAEWDQKKSKTKKKVKDIARELIELYAKRKAAPGIHYAPDGFLQAELESSFIYEDTPDQAKATTDVKNDMEQPYPMDRLVCGDVGFGKTEVAIRAAFKAVANGKQVAVLVPTTILAFQHFRTFSERLERFPVTIDYLNRFRTSAQSRETLKKTEEGKVDILIGTHRLVSKDVKFKDLGLLIVDEEQKFGVKVKDRLKEMRVNVDVLTLTATPIPRTLQFSLMGARDLSIIATPPTNRQPVTTELHVFNEEFIRDAISFELQRGGQVFFVHNRIQDIDEIANIILRLVPDAKVGVAHGQMEGAKLEKIMMKFMDGEYDVLVSTNIIESGLDIPNANTIIINRAHIFGLSDLHQMRGRVGRSNRKAFCYLVTSPVSMLTSDARKRLQTLEEFSELGDGFKVAMRDLDIRGAGNLLGGEQSGFITDLGFEMYHKVLDEAIQELKESEFRDLFQHEIDLKPEVPVPDCSIETDMEIIIPESYVASISERLNLYSKLDSIKNEAELEKFVASMTDRFGAFPPQVEDLIRTVRLRWKAERAGFEKLVLKENVMKGYFLPSDQEAYYKSETFGRILDYVQRHPKTCRMRETSKRLILTVQHVNSIEKAATILDQMVSILETSS